MINNSFLCGICSKEVITNAIECCLCNYWIHNRCADLTKRELTKLKGEAYWCCKNCKTALPFDEVDDYEFMNINCNEDVKVCSNVNSSLNDSLPYMSYDYSEYRSSDFEKRVDPNNNFFNTVSTKCAYYTEDNFNKHFINNTGLSIIHFNARSLSKNLSDIKGFLSGLNHSFDIIAISETWLDAENLQSINIEGYKVTHQLRVDKKGGGCAIFVKNCYKSNVVKNMSDSVNEVLESCTVELCVEKGKNIVVSCVYRTPGSTVCVFIEKVEEMLENIKNTNKICYLCGDININLLNTSSHTESNNFIDTLYSYGLYPLICRPTRVSSGSATLIDNIFTNNICDKISSGIFINDITDHLPIFMISARVNVKNSRKQYRSVRDISSNNVEMFKQCLNQLNWKTVYSERDVNVAYNELVKLFNEAYNKCCPLKRSMVKYNMAKPWFTSGLRNTCKKKNVLYKNFLKHKNRVTEVKYKRYKNKLTGILRKVEKDYYNKLLQNHKNDLKLTWATLNELIKTSLGNVYPEQFQRNGKILTNKLDIANGFNEFFVNVGPSLANKIKSPSNKSHFIT